MLVIFEAIITALFLKLELHSIKSPKSVMYLKTNKHAEFHLRSRTSVDILVPDAVADQEVERESVASSFVTSDEPKPRRTPGAPSFSIRDAPFNEGVVTAVEQTSRLQPPQARGRRSSNASAERTVSFTPDLPTKAAKSKDLSRRQRRQSSGSSSPGSPGSPREEAKKKSSHHSVSPKKKFKRQIKRIRHRRQTDKTADKTSGPARDTPSPHRRRKRKKKRDIAILGVTKFSDLEASDVEDYAPPKHLSPRSAAEYVKNKLKEAAAKRKKKKKKKGSSKAGKKAKGDGTTKKKRKKKKKRKGKRSDGFGDSEDEDVPPRPKKPLGPRDQHFYPTPRNLFKKRCVFTSEANPVVCTICDGIHYRTKRSFAANMKIIININKTLGDTLNGMQNNMKKINTNLERVKKNLDYMEEMYEAVFLKVNRLNASDLPNKTSQDEASFQPTIITDSPEE